jgi:hypothetical protein
VIAYDGDAVTRELVRIARPVRAAHLRGVDFLEQMSPKAKRSTIISPPSVPTPFLTRSRTSIFARSAWNKDLLRSNRR